MQSFVTLIIHRLLRTVFRILLPLVTSVSTISLVPKLLVPLFGGIPLQLHMTELRVGILVGSAILACKPLNLANTEEASTSRLHGLAAICIATIPVMSRKVARYAGMWGGAEWGPGAALGILMGPAVFVNCRVWVDGMVCPCFRELSNRISA